MGQFSPVHWLIVALTIAPMIALVMVPVWRILKRAGFNGAWALLMVVPVANFMLLWCVAFMKWPNDPEGRTRTSVPWIVVGFVMLPLSIGAMVLMASADVQRVATVEQRARPAPPSKGADWEKGVMTPPPNLKPFQGQLDGAQQNAPSVDTTEHWTQESTGSAEKGPWLSHMPPGSRFCRMANGTIVAVFPPGVRPSAEKANPFCASSSVAASDQL